MAASLHIYLQMIKVGKELETQLNLRAVYMYWVYYYTLYCTGVL